MVKILPSVLSADFSILKEEILAVEAAGADMHHVDVMDGHFVPNISFGPVVIKDIKKVATKPLDIHLMITNPDQYLEEYINLKPELITIHAEIANDVPDLLQKIQAAGIKAGLSIKPQTDFMEIVSLLPFVDVLLIMSVEPGFGGQKFIATSLDKIKEAKTYFVENNYNILLEVDGGINNENAPACVLNGADMLVAGSSVYTENKAYAQNIKKLKAGN